MDSQIGEGQLSVGLCAGGCHVLMRMTAGDVTLAAALSIEEVNEIIAALTRNREIVTGGPHGQA